MHVGGTGNQGPGLSYHNLGELGGMPSVTLTEENLPVHDHHLKATTTTSETNDPSGQLTAKHKDTRPGMLYLNNPGNLEARFADQAVGQAGNMIGQPHENRKPFLVTPFCIALDGVFPSRP